MIVAIDGSDSPEYHQHQLKTDPGTVRLGSNSRVKMQRCFEYLVTTSQLLRIAHDSITSGDSFGDYLELKLAVINPELLTTWDADPDHHGSADSTELAVTLMI